jgi:5-methylcytosine-specific restriction endonuclease McrA
MLRKLTPEKVQEALGLKGIETAKSIALRMGVSTSTITMIWAGQNLGEIENRKFPCDVIGCSRFRYLTRPYCESHNREIAYQSKLASNRGYRKRNPEIMRACEDRWKAKNPDAVKAQWATRNATRQNALKSAGPGFTGTQWRAIVEAQAGQCKHCNVFCGDKLSVDHIVPIARGGRHEITNIQGLCNRCNRSKGSRLEDELRFDNAS